MLAIGHLARQLNPALTVEYVTLEEFIEELNHAIGDSAMELFKRRFHMVDMLLLDDVQFLAGRKETQSEMLRLFNTLQRAGKQVVLTSDRPPSEIADLDERLITRLTGGLVVDVGTPDYETRVAILRSKCDERGVRVRGRRARRGRAHQLHERARAAGRAQPPHRLPDARARRPSRRATVRELLGEKPDTPLLVPPQERGQEFASFLSDLSEVVAQHIDSWRVRVVEAMTYWHQLGYVTLLLERTLEATEEPDVDTLLSRYEASMRRLRELEAEAAKLDTQLAASELFKDPERVGEAELVLARLVGGAEPPPGPDPALARSELRGGRVEPARGARRRHHHR